jgi:osmotically-inducible protein OsmY
VETEAQRHAIQVAAETTHGVRAVNNHLRLPHESRAYANANH